MCANKQNEAYLTEAKQITEAVINSQYTNQLCIVIPKLGIFPSKFVNFKMLLSKCAHHANAG